MDSLINLIYQFKVEHDSGISKIEEQATCFENKLKLFESENHALKIENQNLKALVLNLQKANAELKEQLNTPKQSFRDNTPFEQTLTLSPLINTEEGFTEKDISDISLKILKKHGAI